MLRTSALNIISELNITGGCNVQYALNPDSFEYCVIEVNPRVSRSSALASKATGYPIAKVAAKIALGYTLDEIKNAITQKTYASFEPMLDYVVVKLPRLPFDKFISAKRTLTTQMKATGEVMSICNNFEGALMKAIRSLEQHVDSLMSYDFTGLSEDELLEQLAVVDDMRMWKIAEAVRRGIDYDTIYNITKVDRWFIDKFAIIVEMENALKTQELTVDLLREAKRIEFPDNVIARLTGKTEREIHDMRHANGIVAAYKIVDTCAAEFAAETPYYYSVYGSENEVEETKGKKKVLVLGSGPIRIGQGIEFDFCSVHCTWAFAKEGYETIIVNNNPETVSTDFDIADKLYFEPLTPEDVESIVDIEKPDGAVVQFGGQTAIKLTEALMKMGVPILGTSAENVDKAEDRELFDEILEECEIPRPTGGTVFTAEEAKEVANRLGYPVLVRPSYVLGGQGMQIAINDNDIDQFIGIINRIAQDHPILVDKYLQGKEIEVDAVCDGTDILIPGIMEHIERACGHPLRRQYLCLSGAEPDGRGEGKDRRVHEKAGQVPPRHRYDQHPVYRLRRGRRVCDRGKPEVQPYRSVHQQGDRHPDRPAGDPGDHREEDPGAWLHAGTAAGGGLRGGQDAGILLREDPRRRHQPWTGDEVHRRVPRHREDF